MDRVFESGAAAGVPSVPAAPSTGYPTKGDPSTGIAATVPGEWWYHMITEELRGVIAAAGLTPDHTNVAQLLSALQGGFGLGKSLASNGYITLPGGVIVQWSNFSYPDVGTDYSIVLNYPVAFPNAVFAVIAQPDSTQTELSAVTQNVGLTQVTVVLHEYTAIAAGGICRLFMIGY